MFLGQSPSYNREVDMFCPRCGKAMARKTLMSREGWYCESGEMDFAPVVEARLEADIQSMPFEAVSAEHDGEKTAGWYCPRCGQPMAAVGGQTLEKVCTSCGFHLSAWMVYQLVEKHVHK
jgi:predicted RNA-binding Zn-ribbon protein involved in translation (DUF1610 family)